MFLEKKLFHISPSNNLSITNLKITEIKKLNIEEIPIDNYMYDMENIKLFYVF